MVVDLHHVRVAESGGALSLLPEARDETLVFGVFLPEDLQREFATEQPVVGQKYLGHPSGTQEARKGVTVAQDVANHEFLLFLRDSSYTCYQDPGIRTPGMPVMIRSAENGPEGRPRRLAPTPVQAYLFPKATLHKHI